jgi:hypothetical protein
MQGSARSSRGSKEGGKEAGSGSKEPERVSYTNHLNRHSTAILGAPPPGSRDRLRPACSPPALHSIATLLPQGRNSSAQSRAGRRAWADRQQADWR